MRYSGFGGMAAGRAGAMSGVGRYGREAPAAITAVRAPTWFCPGKVMSSQRSHRDDSEYEDFDELLARTPRRDAVRELRDYPFFLPEESPPPMPWVSRYGALLLVAIALLLAIEAAVLVLLIC